MIGRRQFVGTTAFAFAGLAPAGAIGKGAIQSQPYSDPVLDAIIADFHELRREGDAQPGQRRGAVRAAETLNGVLAAHLGKHYDQDLKRAIRQQLQRKGRQALVQDITAKANKADITHEKVDAMLTRLDRDGMAGVLRDVQKVLKRLRDNHPDFLQVRATTVQYDFCADLNWIILLTETAAAIACSLAMANGGVNPAFDAACLAATAALAMYLMMKIWYNC